MICLCVSQLMALIDLSPVDLPDSLVLGICLNIDFILWILNFILLIFAYH